MTDDRWGVDRPDSVRGEVELPEAARRAVEHSPPGAPPVGRLVLLALTFLVAGGVMIGVVVALELPVAGAVLAPLISGAAAVGGLAWRLRRGPRRLDRALAAYLDALRRSALMGYEYQRSAAHAEAAREHLQAGRPAEAWAEVDALHAVLRTVEVAPGLRRPLREVLVRADDLIHPFAGRMTLRLGIFVGGLLLLAGLILPIVAGGGPAVPMIATFVGLGVVTGVGCYLARTETRQRVVLIGVVLGMVVVVGAMGWPDLLNLAGFVGAAAGGVVGIELATRR